MNGQKDSILQRLFLTTKVYEETKDQSYLDQMIKDIKLLELFGDDNLEIYCKNREKPNTEHLMSQIKELSDKIEKNMSSGRSWIIPGVGWGLDSGRYSVYDSETGKRLK